MTSTIVLETYKQRRQNTMAMNRDIPHELIAQFRSVMMSTVDDRKDLQKIINFLGVLQTYRQSIPPTAECITIIKHKKPILFQHLKKSLSPTSHLKFIIQLDMDYLTALERLGLQDDPFFQTETAEE